MRSRAPLCALVLAALCAAPAAQSAATFVARFVSQQTLNPPPTGGVVFLGSSSIRRWERLAYDFAAWDVIQRGIGGSALANLVGWVDEAVVPVDPAAVVVYGGSNGIAPPEPGAPPAEQNTPQEEFQLFVDFVEAVRAQQDPSFPPITVIYVGITPTPARWFLWPEASMVNALIAGYAASEPFVEFIDTAPAFLSTGMPPAAFLFDPDGQHLSQLGYNLWTNAIRPVLQASVPPTRTYQENPLHPARGARVLFDLGPGLGGEGDPTSSPDVNGNHWNNWHPLAGGVKVLAGESLGSLIANDGAPCGMDLVVTGGWKLSGLGGLTAPSAALLRRFAIATATKDYFYTNDGDDPAGLRIAGLDPNTFYHLRFFASRSVQATLVSRYRVAGKGAVRTAQLQTSGTGIGSGSSPHGNVSQIAELRNVRPNAFGELFVDADAISGPAALLALLELEVGAPVFVDQPTGSIVPF